MVISQMTAATVEDVATLEHASFTTPWSVQSIREELNNPWAIWYTATEGSTLLGYIGVQYGLDGGDIMSIATAPEAQGTGVGKALLAAMVQLLKEKELQYLTLEVRPSNAPALGLYRSMGFREVGRRKKYYKNPTEDAILLTLYFEEEPKSC